jgi:uncharacterized protein YbaP (TraB family)
LERNNSGGDAAGIIAKGGRATASSPARGRKDKMNSRRLLAFLSVLLLAAPTAAQTSVQPSIASFRVYPSLWHIKGEAGDVYLLGAVHVLPPNMRWRTTRISLALSHSDVFVFEVPEDAAAVAELHTLIQAQGFLPPDQSLRAQLHAAALPDYDAAVAASGLAPPTLERERPWLAGIQLMFAQMSKLKYTASNGVDSLLMEEAARNHKQIRYFETIADQFALLAPANKNLEVEEFEASLKDLRDISAGIQPMIHAWSVGDQAKLDQLINGDLDEFPEARKLLLDDRNARWVPKIEAMLKEKHVFFVTVGAGHLTGAQGVPALLRRAGYTVDGP